MSTDGGGAGELRPEDDGCQLGGLSVCHFGLSTLEFPKMFPFSAENARSDQKSWVGGKNSLLLPSWSEMGLWLTAALLTVLVSFWPQIP